MNPLAENPFAALTLIVAPAILTNACSVLTLGTSNRIARVVDRSRVITKELEALAPQDPGFAGRVTQFDRLRARSALLIRALTLFYFALGSFAASALISLFGALLAGLQSAVLFKIVGGIAVAVGTLAVGSLAVGCLSLVRETRLAVATLDEEAELIRAQHERATGRPAARV